MITHLCDRDINGIRMNVRGESQRGKVTEARIK